MGAAVSTKNYIRVITHLHSLASNDRASSLYGYISNEIIATLGAVPPEMSWHECYTSYEELREIVLNRRTEKPVDVVFLTDHMNQVTHRLPDEVITLAEELPRFGLGAEVVTYLRRSSGEWVRAPEVLIYGSKEQVQGPRGAYWGLTNELIDQLFRECTLPGAPGLDIYKTLRFCRQNGLAHAAAHPLDGHHLNLRETLRVLRSFSFTETMNGGYSPLSAQCLDAYLHFHNQLVSGKLKFSSAPHRLSAFQVSQVKAIMKRGKPLFPLGGGDAHVQGFDRVVTCLRGERSDAHAGTFIQAMLDAVDNPETYGNRFFVQGKAMTSFNLYREVLPLVLKNVYDNVPAIKPRSRLFEMFSRSFTATFRRLKHLSGDNGTITDDFQQKLNIPYILDGLQGGQQGHLWGDRAEGESAKARPAWT